MTDTWIVRNTDDHRRTWNLRTTSGRVLALGPGEEAELAENPGDVAHLDVRRAKRAAKTEPPTPETPDIEESK